MTVVTPFLLAYLLTGKPSATAIAAGGLGTSAVACRVAGLVLQKIGFLGREKLIYGELEVLEQGAGVFGRPGAFLLRHAEVIGRH